MKLRFNVSNFASPDVYVTAKSKGDDLRKTRFAWVEPVDTFEDKWETLEPDVKQSYGCRSAEALTLSLLPDSVLLIRGTDHK